jgi:4-hydroxythreonine-4-phosphate dehydrogenase
MSTARLLLTPGEPAGIGPDLVLILAASQRLPAQLVAIADPAMLSERAEALGLNLAFHLVDPEQPFGGVLRRDALNVLPLELAEAVQPGQPSSANARHLLNALDIAIGHCQEGRADALVTGPLNKAVVAHADADFRGHTEYLAEACQVKRVVMMLAAPGLRVALATTHLPLRDVADAINAEDLHLTLDIILADLKARYAIHDPCIKVCGLNPHAGEDGLLGSEEQRIIAPVINQKRAQGFDVRGPYPADTVFNPPHLADADLVLAMYHDQGLPVLKHMGFGKAINVTLGLPIIRTSVDHGTAFDLAGTGKADPNSLLAAIHEAERMHQGAAP